MGLIDFQFKFNKYLPESSPFLEIAVYFRTEPMTLKTKKPFSVHYKIHCEPFYFRLDKFTS